MQKEFLMLIERLKAERPEVVVIKNACLDVAEVNAIIEALKDNEKIQSIQLASCNIDASISNLLAMCAEKKINKISLSNSFISCRIIEDLICHLSRMHDLRELDLRSTHGFKETQLMNLFHSTMAICLHKLNVSGLYLQDGAAKSLAEMIHGAAFLQELNVMLTHLSEKGLIELAGGIAKSTSLKTLHLAGNKINGLAGQLLIEAFKKNTSLTAINLNQTHIGHDGVEKFKNLLQVNQKIIRFGIMQNKIKGDETRKKWQEEIDSYLNRNLQLISNSSPGEEHSGTEKSSPK